MAKGAPQVILAMAANTAEVKRAVEKAVDEFAARGFRSLGVMRAENNGRWQFVGVLPLIRSAAPRCQVHHRDCRQMGVKVKMVTGDQLAIAQETAEQLGLGTNILDASSLANEKHHATRRKRRP